MPNRLVELQQSMKLTYFSVYRSGEQDGGDFPARWFHAREVSRPDDEAASAGVGHRSIR
jgi:hypothetical protein